MLQNIAFKSYAGVRRARILRCSSGIHTAIGKGLMDIAGAKHDVHVSMTSKGAPGPLSFMQGGKIAHLADGSGVCSHGGSVVHAAVTTADNPEATDDFLPLTVDYRSRAYAFGRIPSMHNRRERHGNNEDEVLISRIIDRAVRPLFPKGLVDQVQLIATVHAADKIHDPTIASVNAASLALLRSSVDWKGPIGCVRVGMVNGELVLHPTVEQMQSSTLDLVYAGTDARALMLECVGSEIPEAQLCDALELAQLGVKDIINAQLQMLGTKNSSEHRSLSIPMMITAKMKHALIHNKGLTEQEISKLTPVEAHSILNPDLQCDEPSDKEITKTSKPNMYYVPEAMQADIEGFGLQQSVDMFRSCGGLSRKERGLKENGIQTMLIDYLHQSDRWADQPRISRHMAVERCMKKAFRIAVLGHDIRVDGRDFDEVREVKAYADVLPAVHGSSFFQRGDTHVLCTSTLGALSEAKSTVPLDGGDAPHPGFLRNTTALYGGSSIENENANGMVNHKGEKRSLFFLHYDFPPYCTGVVGNAGVVNRRMVGHGNLAERALRPVLPSATEFPYAVRAFAECTSSSGSSSMASACGATLAMLDAGVPLKSSVAGVSVGLVTTREGDPTPSPNTLLDEQSGASYRLLTDILGTEDHYGDMDFKIAGTHGGVTAMQLDIKLEQGLPLSILKAALDAAKKGRLHLLAEMDQAISASRPIVKSTAPAAEVVTYNPERKRLLIGPGGEMVRYIADTYRCSIDTSEDGIAYVFGSDREGVQKAKALILDIVTILEPGQVLTGEVTEIKDFGAFVKLTRSQEAILHVSEISHDTAVTKRPLEQSLAVGQQLRVQVLTVDKGTGAVRVSRKALMNADEEDDIRADSTAQGSIEEQEKPEPGSLRDPLPSFPVIPPRKWSKDFFRSKVVPSEEVEAAATATVAVRGGGHSGGNGNGHRGYIEGGDPSISNRNRRKQGPSQDASPSRKLERKGAGVVTGSVVDTEAMEGIRDAVDNSRRERSKNQTGNEDSLANGATEGRQVGGILKSFLSFVGIGGPDGEAADTKDKLGNDQGKKEGQNKAGANIGRGSAKGRANQRPSAPRRFADSRRRPSRGKGNTTYPAKKKSTKNTHL